MGGSFGTLGILTELTFKVRPVPPEYCLAVIPYERAADAFAAAHILNEALPLANLEILSPTLAARFNSTSQYLLLGGFCGSPLEIGYQAERIRDLIGARGEFLDDDIAQRSYELLRDLDVHTAPLAAQIAAPPAFLARVLETCGAEYRAHAGSGVAQIFIVGEPSAESAATTVARWREAAHSARGNLRLLAAHPTIRDSLEFFDTPNDGALAIMRRLKAAFDPAGIFNPGCFVGGI
jgi:glycolate oxidase FAD binding subunit